MTIPSNLFDNTTESPDWISGTIESPFFALIILLVIICVFLWVLNRRKTWHNVSLSRIAVTATVSSLIVIIYVLVTISMQNLYPWLTIPFVLSVFLMLPLIIMGLSNAVAGAVSSLAFVFTYLVYLTNYSTVGDWFYLYFLINPALTSLLAVKLKNKDSFFFYFLGMYFTLILVGFLV